MMRLHTHPASPFGRKVLVAAHELGLAAEIRVEHRKVSPVEPHPEVVADNPLGKLPTLVREDGTPLVDSRVICEYLDARAGGGRLHPEEPELRWRALMLQALADGMMEASILARYETVLRPEALRWPAWVEHQKLKVARTLDRIEQEAQDLDPEAVHIGLIALACALGYLDFRFAEDGWRQGRPRLAAWFERYRMRPAMQATLPRDLVA